MGNSQLLNSNTNGTCRNLKYQSGGKSHRKLGVQLAFPTYSAVDTTYSLRSPNAARSKPICPYGYVYEITDLAGCDRPG